MSIRQRFEFEDLEALRVGRYGNRVNTSCIVYRLGDTVIDTGPPNMWRDVRHFLKERDIGRILVTHHHEDHSGNLGRIHKICQPQVLAHNKSLPLLRNSFKVPFYRRLVWGRPRLKIDAEALPKTLDIGSNIQLKPIHTPGHSEDMTCFLEPHRGWVFSGDLYVASKPKYALSWEDPNQEIESLRHLLTHDFQTVFCSHRGILEDGRAAIARKLNYLLALREQVRHYRQTGDSMKDIKKRLMGRETFLFYFSFGEYSKSNYIRAFAKHSRRKCENSDRLETAESEG